MRMTAPGFRVRSRALESAPGCDLELRSFNCCPLPILHHRQLQRSLAVEVEIANVEEDRRLHPCIDRAEEVTRERLDPGAELVAGVAAEHDDRRVFDVVRQELLGAEEMKRASSTGKGISSFRRIARASRSGPASRQGHAHNG
jgi:hypothetical protein